MRIANIKYYDVADGPGVRVSVFVSGCTNHCVGCFQPETWDFDYGQVYTKQMEEEILSFLAKDFVQGLTLLGGDPFEFVNQEGLVSLCQKVKAQFPDKNIWCYTGFILDQDLLLGGRRHGSYTDQLLSLIDVLVDGPFIQEQKNLMLPYCGSENQRVIDLVQSLQKQEIILVEAKPVA